MSLSMAKYLTSDARLSSESSAASRIFACNKARNSYLQPLVRLLNSIAGLCPFRPRRRISPWIREAEAIKLHHVEVLPISDSYARMLRDVGHFDASRSMAKRTGDRIGCLQLKSI